LAQSLRVIAETQIPTAGAIGVLNFPAEPLDLSPAWRISPFPDDFDRCHAESVTFTTAGGGQRKTISATRR